jgi:hypothetical protein
MEIKKMYQVFITSEKLISDQTAAFALYSNLALHSTLSDITVHIQVEVSIQFDDNSVCAVLVHVICLSQ